MEPTQPNTQSPAPGQSLVEYVRKNRQNAGIVLAVLAVLFLAGTAFLALKGFRTPAEPEKPADKPAVENPFDPESPELPKATETPAQIQSQYHLAWIGTLMAFFVTAAGAGWLFSGLPASSEEKQRTEARVLILAVGGLLGVLLVLYGVMFFYIWRDSLTAWLSKGEVRESRWVLIPVMMMVTGAGLVFLAVQPARAEERNNPRIRRLVYGSNFGLTVLLLLIALAVANVVFAMRVPNELDTTSSGFYSLSDETRELVKRLDPAVTVYAVIPEGGRVIGDIRQLLAACEDASGGRVKAKFINPSANRRELADLISRYPQLELPLADRRMGRLGALVLTVGPDEKRHKIVPVPELFANNAFVGESRLFNELTLLADNQVKPVVYFTQSNRELSVAPGGQVPDDDNASRLRAYLEKLYLEVRPLDLSGVNPTVPDDAAIVVVAGPRDPLRAEAVAALRKYVNTPRGADAKPGKLIVLAGIVPGPGGKGVVKTGLEGLLAEMNIQIGEKFVYSLPDERNPYPLVVQAMFSTAARTSRHPVVVNLAKAVSTLSLPLAREVLPLNTNPALRPTVLLAAAGPTWLEDNPLQPEKAQDTLLDLLQKANVRAAKQYAEQGRPLGIAVAEGATARAAVFGCADFVSDEAAREYPPDSVPATFDLIGETIGWLREKPSAAAVEIKAKQYQEYKFPDPSSVSATRLVYLPLALGLLAVIGLGAGVWVIRRK